MLMISSLIDLIMLVLFDTSLFLFELLMFLL